MMEKAGVPIENAFEPKEGAKQPTEPTRKMPDKSKKLTFANDTDDNEKSSSQRSISYKEVLSQPDGNLSHRQRLQWLQKRRTPGLWVQCDECDRWRYLSGVLDNHELPNKWYCRMNPDTAFASCSVGEAPLRVRDEEDLIHSEYASGSVVWARLAGWPWWPAMVDDCPDAEQYYWLDGFSDIPTHYNVVFFDSTEVTRAWIAPDQLQPYTANKRSFKHLTKNKALQQRLKAAIAQADEAKTLQHPARLAKYSFIARHNGKIKSPKKITKADLEKYQKKFRTKYNVDMPVENSDSDEEVNLNRNDKAAKRKNVIILGTPKSSKKPKSRVAKKLEDIISLLPEEQNQVSEEVQDSETMKRPNSLMAQAGSTFESGMTTSIDNDTSDNYEPPGSTNIIVPPASADTEDTMHNPDFTIRIETPNSDDFDF